MMTILFCYKCIVVAFWAPRVGLTATLFMQLDAAHEKRTRKERQEIEVETAPDENLFFIDTVSSLYRQDIPL